MFPKAKKPLTKKPAERKVLKSSLETKVDKILMVRGRNERPWTAKVMAQIEKERPTGMHPTGDTYKSLRAAVLDSMLPVAGYTVQSCSHAEHILYFKDAEAASAHVLKKLKANPRAQITLKPIYTVAE